MLSYNEHFVTIWNKDLLFSVEKFSDTQGHIYEVTNVLRSIVTLGTRLLAPFFYLSRNEGHLHSWKLVYVVFVDNVSQQTPGSRFFLE